MESPTRARPVTSVRFVLDANNNGQYDSGDTILGLHHDIAGGNASSTLNTTGYAAGTYHILAAAQNSKGNWMRLGRHDLDRAAGRRSRQQRRHGHDGRRPQFDRRHDSANGDMGWFKFQATAGKSTSSPSHSARSTTPFCICTTRPGKNNWPLTTITAGPSPRRSLGRRRQRHLLP